MDGRAGRGQNPERAADARLGRAIRAVRRERGLTLAQVAGAAELSQPFLSQLELGRTRPSMRSLFRIAGALGTTQQALLAAANDEGVDLAVAADTGRARLLMHDPDRADVTEFVGAPGEFHDFFRHDRHELLYVVRGAIEVEVREHGDQHAHHPRGPRDDQLPGRRGTPVPAGRTGDVRGSPRPLRGF